MCTIPTASIDMPLSGWMLLPRSMRARTMVREIDVHLEEMSIGNEHDRHQHGEVERGSTCFYFRGRSARAFVFVLGNEIDEMNQW